MTIVHFSPRSRVKAETNLKNFIHYCRHELTVLGADLAWDSNTWSAAGVTFGNVDQRTKKLHDRLTLTTPFLDFAKAYCRYHEGIQPKSAVRKLFALRCLERALLDCIGESTVARSDMVAFDRAAVIAREYYSQDFAYMVGRELHLLAAFLTSMRCVLQPIDWKNGIARPNSTVRTGAKAKALRDRRLPEQGALDAMAAIFASNPTHPRDIFSSGVAAMLLCAPCRISELLALRVDCEVWEDKKDGTRAYGWRFQPGKGAPPGIKWIPSAMENIAQEAIGRIRRVTEEARRLAAWLEDNPERFFPHESSPDIRETRPLSGQEVLNALGLGQLSSGSTFLFNLGLSRAEGAHTLHDLNLWAHARLPKSFPFLDARRGVKCRDALFIFRRGELRTDCKCPGAVELSWPNADVFNHDMGDRPQVSSQSIFQRHSYQRPDGTAYKITSHQFRHYLNSLAQRGGLSQAELARWSGRIDIRQNRAYDHMSEFELVDMLRAHDSDLRLDRPLQEISERLAEKLPMTQQEFNALAMPTAHVTEFGFCIHDFVMSPCQRFRDCLNCTEQVCIKGDRRLDHLRHRLQQVSELVARAEEEIAEGTAGADRWYEIHLKTQARLSELISILENPSIPDGTIVRLRDDEDFSPLRRTLRSRSVGLESSKTSKLPARRN